MGDCSNERRRTLSIRQATTFRLVDHDMAPLSQLPKRQVRRAEEITAPRPNRIWVREALLFSELGEAKRYRRYDLRPLAIILSCPLCFIQNEQAVVVGESCYLDFAGRGVPRLREPFFPAAPTTMAAPHRARNHRGRGLAGFASAANTGFESLKNCSIENGGMSRSLPTTERFR
jgi:hypothetical protein